MPLAFALRRALLATLATLAFSAPAFAQGGINLSWDDCGSFGRAQKNFACDSNAGQELLVGSAVTQIDLPQVNGMTAIIDLQTNRPVLSDWWQLGAGGCRGGALTADFDFATGFVNCFDAWAGTSSGGVTYQPFIDGQRRARIQITCATATPVSIVADEEYYFFKVALLHSASTGNGSCAGCTDAVCLQFPLMQLTQSSGLFNQTITAPLTRSNVMFQPNLGGTCPFMEQLPVATRSRTWGAVKSLYR